MQSCSGSPLSRSIISIVYITLVWLSYLILDDWLLTKPTFAETVEVKTERRNYLSHQGTVHIFFPFSEKTPPPSLCKYHVNRTSPRSKKSSLYVTKTKRKKTKRTQNPCSQFARKNGEKIGVLLHISDQSLACAFFPSI